MFLIVDSFLIRIRNFNFFLVVVWRNFVYFVVLDEEKKRVYIFDEGGEIIYIFRIMYGDFY